MKTKENELVSIIVPVYNVEKYIVETIECVRRQTCPRWELLLVEDVSTDGTRQAIQGFLNKAGDERVRLICQPVNKGAAHARNIGLSAAKGRYIAFLDAADLW